MPYTSMGKKCALSKGKKTMGFRMPDSKDIGIRTPDSRMIEMLFAGDIWRCLP